MHQFIITNHNPFTTRESKKKKPHHLNLFTMTIFLLVLMALISSTTSTNQDIQEAIDEMQKANYFTFVMLINMAPPDLIQGNITFLMPNDRTLSKTKIAESSVVDFLLRHSIPSPLLIDHLEHFPTGSTIPTSRPGFVLKVTNDGRRRFFLNNARIISPNICTGGSSIRCHGVDGVVNPMMMPQPNIPPPSSCVHNSSNPPPEANAPMPTPSPSPSPPESGGGSPVSVVAPPPDVDHVTPPKKSSSPRMLAAGAVNLVMVIVFTLCVV